MSKYFWMIIFVITLVLLPVKLHQENGDPSDELNPGILINITVAGDKYGKVSFYEEYVLPPLSVSEITVDLEKVQNDRKFGFAILEVHAFLYNVSLAFNSSQSIQYQNGTNLGVNIYESGQVYVYNMDYHTSVHVAVVLIAYKRNIPIPGRCNLEAGTLLDDTAVLGVTHIRDIVQVDAPLASDSREIDPDRKYCKDFLNYSFYYKLLPQNDLTSYTYFKGIRAMLEVSKIKNTGSRAAKLGHGPTNRRKFIALSGTGIIVNVIARDSQDKTVAYIPTVSYSCHPLWRKNDCRVIPYSVEWVIPAILLIIIGLIRVFVVFEDHLPNLFFNTFPVGCYAAFCVIAFVDDLNNVGRIGIIIISGLTVALVFCVLCNKLKTSDVALDLTSKLILSWILAACILFLLNDNPFFAKDWIYWSTFFTIMTLSFLTMLPFCNIVPIIVHVLTGMNAILFGIQILLRSNMLLIVLNHLYRIRDATYKTANGIPKPSAEDIAVFVTMPVLIALGIFFQIKKIIYYGKKAGEPTPDRPLITRWGSDIDEVFESPQANRKFLRRLSSKTGGYRPFN